MRRILGRLRRAGLVTGRAGPGGGYRLRRPLRTTPLEAPYRAVEPRPVVRLHARPNPGCPVGRHVGGILAAISRRMERAVLEALHGQTLADVVSRVRARAHAAGV